MVVSRRDGKGWVRARRLARPGCATQAPRARPQNTHMWWKACCATYATRRFGCFQTVPMVGTVSPVRHLIMVDLPAPLTPTHATRDDSDTVILMSTTVGAELPG